MPLTTTRFPEVKNYIGGKFVGSVKKSMDVLSPLDGSVISTVPLSAIDDLNSAVESAQNAFQTWSFMPIKERVQIFFRYKTLLEKNLQELATLVHEENGKTIDEAIAEVEKSIELLNFYHQLKLLHRHFPLQ